jgi:hypothetical protein
MDVAVRYRVQGCCVDEPARPRCHLSRRPQIRIVPVVPVAREDLGNQVGFHLPDESGLFDAEPGDTPFQ